VNKVLATLITLGFQELVSIIKARTPKITVGTAAPTNPAVGDLWVDTN
jgi:hypothetical protein